ncbi:MAG: right-handed parallel beta-helix repeat-containing protein, partial [Chloroflexales bacterium]|nr:right-handed parallel beta-helix repeat-containing protein [Chloroflexales bacterium]
MDRRSPRARPARLRALSTFALFVTFIASLLGPAPAARAASFVVTNTNDSGAGSLRQALLDSNATAGADTISFNIPGVGPHLIAPTSILPAATDAVTIDGTTQPGYAGEPRVEISGQNIASSFAAGLALFVGSSTVRGLAINRFRGVGSSGINLGGLGTYIVEDNYLGTDPNGVGDVGNDVGVRVGAPNALIRDNLISGNNFAGIWVRSAGATIQGNLIGTDASGSFDVGNQDRGVLVDTTSGTVIGGTTLAARNVISGNETAGIDVTSSPNVTVQGNYIGTDSSGSVAIGGARGISISSSGGTLVGGTTPGAGNLISGNGTGIDFVSAFGNTVQGNLIGTDATGRAALPNGVGIWMAGSPNNILVGGATPGARNIISANTSAGIIVGGSSNVVQGNLLGANSDGQPLGNGGNGVTVEGAGNRIGGTGAGEANTISHNGGAGVLVVSGASNTGNTVRGNSIDNNAFAGIDLQGIGNNDVGDADTGSNNGQNFPFIGRAIPNGSSTRFEGLFYGAPNAALTLDLYASPACGATGFGQGQRYLGAIPALQFVSATVTDAGGNTSEFSQCISAGPGNDSWPRALDLASGIDYSQYVDLPDQSRWFKLRVQPDSRALVSLAGLGGAPLPADYDLSVYKDISQAYTTLTSSQDLVRLSAEFAGGDFNTPVPGALDPQTLVPSAFDVADFDPANFDRAVIAPQAHSPQAHSPQAHSPQAHSPDAFAPQAHSPDEYAPQAHSPQAHSPEQEAYANAQSRSAVAVSALDGGAPESVSVGTWNNTGDFYVRVRGRNGAYNTGGLFNIQVTLLTGECRNLQAPTGTYAGVSGSHRTVILTDMARMQGDTDRAALVQRLNDLAAATDGVVIDVAG